MNNFITLTDECDGERIILNMNNIAYMRSTGKNNTIIHFSSQNNTKYGCSLAGIIVKESLDEVQSKMYL